MTHKEVIKRFSDIYPIDENDIECWFPCGKNTIRIRLKKGSDELKFWHSGDLVLTYNSRKNWKLQTVDSYLESIKVKEK